MKKTGAWLLALCLCLSASALCEGVAPTETTVPMETADGTQQVVMQLWESELGFSAAYDGAVFAPETDALFAKADKRAYFAAQRISDITAADLRDGLVLQSGEDSCTTGEDVLGTLWADGGIVAETVAYQTVDDGRDMLYAFWLVQLPQDVLLLECGHPLDAAQEVVEGLQVVLGTLRLTETAEATETSPSSQGQAQPEMVCCDACGNWYEAGNEFRNHICAGQTETQAQPEMVYCDACGNWYEAGNVFRNHICAGQAEAQAQPEMVYCDACGGWYEAGNEFRNHICAGQAQAQPEMVYCDACGNWYEAGNEFRNHICAGQAE